MTSDLELSPMEIILKRISPAGAATYMQHRRDIMANPDLQELSLRQELLIGIGDAASLQSSRCTLMWAKQARQEGVRDEEIVEAILVARLMKAATVNDTAAEALKWLDSSREAGSASVK
jgi:alkylhydroperoxidase/carboxymuconolactone decarboxylase family protein YurZ